MSFRIASSCRCVALPRRARLSAGSIHRIHTTHRGARGRRARAQWRPRRRAAISRCRRPATRILNELVSGRSAWRPRATTIASGPLKPPRCGLPRCGRCLRTSRLVDADHEKIVGRAWLRPRSPGGSGACCIRAVTSTLSGASSDSSFLLLDVFLYFSAPLRRGSRGCAFSALAAAGPRRLSSWKTVVGIPREPAIRPASRDANFPFGLFRRREQQPLHIACEAFRLEFLALQALFFFLAERQAGKARSEASAASP